MPEIVAALYCELDSRSLGRAKGIYHNIFFMRHPGVGFGMTQIITKCIKGLDNAWPL